MIEFEVEITDLIALKTAYGLEGTSPTGELMMIEAPDAGSMAGSIFMRGAYERLKESGVNYMGGSVLPRFVDDDGNYPEFAIPAMPGRGDPADL
ncbi:hypothetical protein [Kribbella sp. NPDC006257]|uniref:hypothetical protein n=1 Tax=Kribbella sp. NPDC006257 TaxID=3156738 RepID=UPI0033BBE934